MIAGVGITDKGEFASIVDRKPTQGYVIWKHMLERCYDPKYVARFPTYAGCSVSDDFKSFQRFMTWATTQKGYGELNSALDKDLIVKGNKVYSRETCVFLPRAINVLLTKADAKRGACPVGVSINRGKYMATLCYYGTNKNLGRYATPEEAFSVYKAAKEAHIKALAEQYKEVLDERAYVALQCYKVSEND